MTIEFTCPHCQKFLSTEDDKAGKAAKCPGCGQEITVPQPQRSHDFDAFAGAEGTGSAPPETPAEADAAASDTQTCPACGAEIKAAAIRCRYCGEDLVHRGPYEHTPTTADERTWAMLCHLSTFAGSVVPFGNIIGPLVVWLIKKDEMPLVDDQGKEALNFQISVMIYFAICIPLVFVIIGIFLMMALGVFDIVVTIIAAIEANKGKAYRYPLTIRMVR